MSSPADTNPQPEGVHPSTSSSSSVDVHQTNVELTQEPEDRDDPKSLSPGWNSEADAALERLIAIIPDFQASDDDDQNEFSPHWGPASEKACAGLHEAVGGHTTETVDSNPFDSTSEESSVTQAPSGPHHHRAPAMAHSVYRSTQHEEKSHHYREETPSRSFRAKKEGRIATVHASGRLQCTLGEHDPVPYSRPPPIQPDLVQAFEDGLREYGGEKSIETEPEEEESSGAHIDIDDGKKQKAKAEEPSTSTTILFPSSIIVEEEEGEAANTTGEGDELGVDDFDSLIAIVLAAPLRTEPSVVTPLGEDRKRTLAKSDTEQAPRQAMLSAARQKKARFEDMVGLSVLPASASASWVAGFPGNTPALSKTLLTWNQTMNSFYAKCGHELVEMHPVFPYPPTNPLTLALLSVSFLDTSTDPPKELRFIGPGDVNSMFYCEVDTFRVRGRVEGDKQRFGASRAARAGYERLVESKAIPSLTPTKMADMRQRNDSGEGRWCFIVVRGTTPPDAENETRVPHAVVAWPESAVTRVTNCLHNVVLPEEDKGVFETNSMNAATMSSSPAPMPPVPASPFTGQMPITTPPPLFPEFANIEGLYEELRSATTTSFPALPTDSLKNSVTIKRFTLDFEKAGKLPLVEAYRTDAKTWIPFLDAVGKGQGKVVLCVKEKKAQ